MQPPSSSWLIAQYEPSWPSCHWAQLNWTEPNWAWVLCSHSAACWLWFFKLSRQSSATSSSSSARQQRHLHMSLVRPARIKDSVCLLGYPDKHPRGRPKHAPHNWANTQSETHVATRTGCEGKSRSTGSWSRENRDMYIYMVYIWGLRVLLHFLTAEALAFLLYLHYIYTLYSCALAASYNTCSTCNERPKEYIDQL